MHVTLTLHESDVVPGSADIDPANFSHRKAARAVVVDGQPVVGVVYDPFLDRMYTSIKGNGSFCNEEKLNVSTGGLDDGVVAVASDVKEITRLPYILNIPKPVTFSGPIYKSTLVAKGRFVGFVEAGPTDHDMAAVQVIVEEAGEKLLIFKVNDWTIPSRLLV